MASELKTCPFCGSDRITVQCIRDGQQAICKDCGSKGKPVFHGPKGPDATWGEAVDAWNTRPSPVAPVSPDATGNTDDLPGCPACGNAGRTGNVICDICTPERIAIGECGELVSVGAVNQEIIGGVSSGQIGIIHPVGYDQQTIELVTRSQAEELLAAITKERDHWKEYSSGQGKLIESGVFVTNDEYVRLTALEAKLAAAEKALEPFVSFFNEAMKGFTEGYAERTPSDKPVLGWNNAYLLMQHFIEARATLGGKPS